MNRNARLVRKEAEETVIAVKQEYERKELVLSSREKAVSDRESTVQSKEDEVALMKSDIEAEIKVSATNMIAGRIKKLEKEYEEKAKVCAQKFQKMRDKYFVAFVGVLIYGILVTIFEAVYSKAFSGEFISFFATLGRWIWTVLQGICSAGTVVAELGNRIPQSVIAFLIYWLLQLGVSAVIFVGVGFVIIKVLQMIAKYIHARLWDEISIAVLLGILATFIFNAEKIISVIPVNLILLYLLVLVAYAVVRAVIEIEDDKKRNDILVSVGCGIFALVVMWYGFKSLADGLSALAR